MESTEINKTPLVTQIGESSFSTVNQGQPAMNLPKTNKFDIKKIKTDLQDKFNVLPKNKKIMILVVGILFLIIFILLFLSLLFGKKKIATLQPTSSPSPIAVTPAPNIIFNASRYATDAGVLKIEDNLNAIEKEINSTDVKQSDLNVPNLDFNITFNK